MTLLSQQEDVSKEGVRNRGGQNINTVAVSSQYLPNNNTYKTELFSPSASSSSLNQQQQADLITTTNNLNGTSGIIIINNNYNNNSLKQAHRTRSNVGKEIKANSRGESGFSDNLVNFCKTNCLLTCLLGATLFASIANTFLLSLVVKSIQLNDKGLLNGQLNWDDSSESSVFQLPTRLGKDKSISLNSIESLDDDRPLRLEIWKRQLNWPELSINNPPTSDYHTKEPSNSNEIFLPNFYSTRPRSLSSNKFLLTSSLNQDDISYIEQQKDAISKFNYMAIAESDSNKNINNEDSLFRQTPIRNKENFMNERLELGTKSLALILIIDGHQQVNFSPDQSKTLAEVDNNNGTNKWLTWQQNSGLNEQTSSSSSSSSTLKRLLEYDDERQSIILPLENKLNLSPATATTKSLSSSTSGSSSSASLLVKGKLKSSTISGSLNRNLDVQNQNGDLDFASEFGDLNLISKSSKVHLTSNEELSLESGAGNLVISSDQLYFSKGVHFFDKEPPSTNSYQAFNDEDDNHKQVPETISSNNINEDESIKLRAFNLNIVNGILMASN